MTAIGGYTSDINISTLNYVGNFPLTTILGGFGITTSTTENNYKLSLNPTLTTYVQGMAFRVFFNQTNTDSSVLNIDELGERNLVKVVDGVIQDVVADDIQYSKAYYIIYDGTHFQVVNPSLAVPIASESRVGVTRLATTAEVLVGANENIAVSPKKLKDALVAKENQLGNPPTEGLFLTSTTSGVRSFIAPPTSTSLLQINTIEAQAINDIDEQTIGSTYTIAANVLDNKNMLSIKILGETTTNFNKVFRVRFKETEIFNYHSSSEGPFSITLNLYAFNGAEVLVDAVFLLDGELPFYRNIVFSIQNFVSEASEIKFTGSIEGMTAQTGFITRKLMALRLIT